MSLTPTTPKEIDAVVRGFCHDIYRELCISDPSDPVFVLVNPVDGGERSECCNNVTKKINSSGGKPEYGRIIWLCPEKFIEAEHHAIWESPEGKRIDVTPHEEDRILFLPTPEPFEKGGYTAKANIRKSLSNDPRIVQYLEKFACIEQLQIQYRQPETGLVDMPLQAALKMDELRDQIVRLREEMEGIPSRPFNVLPAAAGRVRRNAPCPCGSGKKFKKCCGRGDSMKGIQ